MKTKKEKLSIILRSLISFGLLVLLIWIMRDDIGGIARILKNSNKHYFIVGLCINVPMSILLSYRLKLLMTGQKIFLPLKDFIYLTFIGFFFNNFLPTAIGGDIAKAYYASKKTDNKVASYAAVLSDRLFGLLAFLFIATAGLIFIGKGFNNNKIIYAVSFVFAALAFVAVLLFRKNKNTSILSADSDKGAVNKIKIKLDKIYRAINSYRNNPFLIVKVVLLSILMQSFTIAGIYFFILSIGGYIPLLKLFLLIPIVWAVSMLPSLNGLGVRESAFVYFLKPDIGAERAFAISLLWLGIIIAYSLVGGILHMIYPVKVKSNCNVRGD
ncbi:MAG: flippase-like domain-containing protein [Candidatus Omnitrophica bacterium]|nr:flippase-like domain-containing protein [Candidatus Omnitrophota bacterium]